MRSMLATLALAYGLVGMAEFALATVYAPGRIYVPGHIRDGVYIRPHFVSTPKLEHGIGPVEPGALKPKPQMPLLQPAPLKDHGELGEPS
jgi:hypothetical protein